MNTVLFVNAAIGFFLKPFSSSLCGCVYSQEKIYLFIDIVEYKIETFLCKNIFSMPATNYKAHFGLAIKIYSV